MTVSDARWSAATATGYSFALGMASVALPLQAVAAGYDAVEVGLLVAASAVSQMVSRLFLGKVMRRVPDWLIITSACALLALSCLVVAAASTPVPFLVAQLLQGISRACFWTGSQTHVVRGEGSSIKALASINLVGNLGLLSGPIAAGILINDDARLALGVAAAAAAGALVPACRMHRLPPFQKLADRQPGQLWQRPGVWDGCRAGITAGGWRALLGSYVPLALVAAGQSPMSVGLLIAAANAASILGAWIVRHVVDGPAVRRTLDLGTAATGLAIAATGVGASSWPLVGLALVVSGIAAGALQTLGPAIAADAVHAQERGEAIAAIGTFRAASLLLTPVAAAGLVALVPLAATIGITGMLLAVPLGRRARG